jgi:hypothetical protein
MDAPDPPADETGSDSTPARNRHSGIVFRQMNHRLKPELGMHHSSLGNRQNHRPIREAEPPSPTNNRKSPIQNQ